MSTKNLFSLLMVVILSLTACVAPPPPAQTGASDSGAAAAPAASDAAPTYANWDEVLAAAKGTTVNWHMWGGADKINTDVDNDIGAQVEALFGVKLNRVPLQDTADAVNKVLNEKQGGVNTGGSIDLIWINGENFKTMKQGGLLYPSWAASLPNAKYVNWDDPALANDFGTPVDGQESPWGHAQFVMEYDSAVVGDAPPKTFEALAEWIAANPGQFTYPAIPDFTGSVFVRHVFYWAAGTPDPFLGEFSQEEFDKHAPKVWEYLNGIEPNLWRNGETYPDGPAAQQDLLANQEVAFSMGYGPSNASLKIADGSYPETIRTFIFDTGTLANNSYVAIPYNSANPAGAMVVANYILSPEFQLALMDPDKWGWLSPVDVTKYDQAFQDTVKGFKQGVATLPTEVLNSNALPEPSGDWVTAMEKGWTENVLQK